MYFLKHDVHEMPFNEIFLDFDHIGMVYIFQYLNLLHAAELFQTVHSYYFAHPLDVVSSMKYFPDGTRGAPMHQGREMVGLKHLPSTVHYKLAIG